MTESCASRGRDAAQPPRDASRDAEGRPPGRESLHEDLHLTISNDLGELARVNELVEELLGRRGVAQPIAYATHLALEEVLSNVIRHGYPNGGRHGISLKLRAGEGGVELCVVDDGREFDPVRAPLADLDLPLAERRAGGLGLHLLRAFVSEMRYERLGDRNFLRLRI